MSPTEYRERCKELGFSDVVLAEMLGITKPGLYKRWKQSEPIRQEAVLALEALEVRVLIHRNAKTIFAKNTQPAAT